MANVKNVELHDRSGVYCEYNCLLTALSRETGKPIWLFPMCVSYSQLGKFVQDFMNLHAKEATLVINGYTVLSPEE